MTNENKKNQDQDQAFHAAFGHMLNNKREEDKTEDVNISPPQESLEEALFGVEDTQETKAELPVDYLPPSIGDPNWEAFESRPPIPPMDRESEARAVAVGLQELRKTREYMLYMYRHMSREYKKMYVTYGLLFEKYFEESYGELHMKINDLIVDMEHLIAGDINEVEAVKENYKLFQEFEEKRLQILYDILAFYEKK